jgi:hypothetical protein
MREDFRRECLNVMMPVGLDCPRPRLRLRCSRLALVQLVDDVDQLGQHVRSAVIRGCGYRFLFRISRRLDDPVVNVETVDQVNR